MHVFDVDPGERLRDYRVMVAWARMSALGRAEASSDEQVV